MYSRASVADKPMNTGVTKEFGGALKGGGNGDLWSRNRTIIERNCFYGKNIQRQSPNKNT